MRKNIRWIGLLGVGLVVMLLRPVQYAFAGIPPDAAQSSLVATSAGSDTAPADGSSTASMTLTFKDAGGSPLASYTAVLSLPSDPSAVVSPSSAVTDSNGQAVFTITSTTAGTFSIDATDQGTSTTLTALGQVTFTAVSSGGGGGGGSSSSSSSSNSSSNTCTQTAPSQAPDFYQVNMQGAKAILYYVQPQDQFDTFTISYGLTSSTDNYSVTYRQDRVSSAISYAINDLNPNLSYFFKIRASNGCAAGPWSQVRQTNTQLKKLPATGPSNMIMVAGFSGFALLLTGVVFLIL